MKKKEIINLIEQESQNTIVPDLSAQIMQKKPLQTHLHESINDVPFTKKRISTSLFTKIAFACVVLLFMGFIVGNLLNNNNNKQIEISEANKTYASEVVTLTNLANQYSLNNKKQSTSYKKISTKNNESLEEISSLINQYVLSVESLFQQDSFNYELYETNGEYKYEIIVKNDLYEYKILYNEVLENDVTNLNGVIYSKFKDYNFKITSVEKAEECNVILELFVDESNSFVLNQEIKNNENIYNISYKYKGETYANFTLKTLFTSESKKVALFIDKYTEFVFEKTSNGYTVDYKFIILSGKLQISETDTQYIYTVNDFEFVIDK